MRGRNDKCGRSLEKGARIAAAGSHKCGGGEGNRGVSLLKIYTNLRATCAQPRVKGNERCHAARREKKFAIPFEKERSAVLFYFLVIFITEMSISREENTRISRHFTESLVAKVVNKIGRLKFNYPSGEWKRGCSRKDFSE